MLKTLEPIQEIELTLDLMGRSGRCPSVSALTVLLRDLRDQYTGLLKEVQTLRAYSDQLDLDLVLAQTELQNAEDYIETLKDRIKQLTAKES